MLRELDVLFTKWGAMVTCGVCTLIGLVGLCNSQYLGCLMVFLLPAALFGYIGYSKYQRDVEAVKAPEWQMQEVSSQTPFYLVEPPRKSPESDGLFLPDDN